MIFLGVESRLVWAVWGRGKKGRTRLDTCFGIDAKRLGGSGFLESILEGKEQP